MAIKFILMVNKQGQTRLASYYDWLTIEERTALESEIIRKCLSRTEMQCSFMEYRGMKVVYRRYASLFFIVGVEQDEEARQSSCALLSGALHAAPLSSRGSTDTSIGPLTIDDSRRCAAAL